MSNVTPLPILKQGATLAERLHEMAHYAEHQPERFEKFVMVYRETTAEGRWKYRTMHEGCKLEELIGLLEIGKIQIHEDSCT